MIVPKIIFVTLSTNSPDRVPDMGIDLRHGKARAPDAVGQLLRDELTHALADEDIPWMVPKSAPSWMVETL